MGRPGSDRQGLGGVIRRKTPPDTVHVIDKAPHSKLFEHVQAVVHHGGAGTTHTGSRWPAELRRPGALDQPYWGRLLDELGVGPQPVRLRKLTPQTWPVH